MSRKTGVLFTAPHDEAVAYVDELSDELERQGHPPMLERQRYWLAFCITGTVVTNVLNWRRFERASAGEYDDRAIGAMFKDSPILWPQLLGASMRVLMNKYGVTEGSLVIDDTERKRSRSTKTIFGVHKMKDKKTNGYIMGQELVVLVLVSKKITLPVGFWFYLPDPVLKAWKENDDALKEQGVAKASRPAKPKRSKDFPTKQGIGMRLVRQFRHRTASKVNVKAILADAAYMSGFWIAECSKVYPKAQVISQIKKDQLVRAGDRPPVTAEAYFSSVPAKTLDVSLRGLPPKPCTMASGRLHVQSLGRTLHIVALKYDDEQDYRYLAATDLTWRALDVVHQYSWRWLIEVFNQDWKLYGGWGKLACQRGADGARRGVTLSVLVDHFLLAHPYQHRLGIQGQPLLTAGSMQNTLQLECMTGAMIQQVFNTANPQGAFEDFITRAKSLIELRKSNKHLSGKSVETFEPSSSLAKRFGKKRSRRDAEPSA